MHETTPPPQRTRCYSCARHADAGADNCAHCGVAFKGCCACGAPRSLFAASCGACGRKLVPRRLPRGKLPWVRAARWGLLAAAAGAGAWFWFVRNDEEPPWAIKARASQAFRDGRFRDAADAFRRLTLLTPRDAEVWHDLAVSYRRLGMGPDVVLPPVRAAAERAPSRYATRMLAAATEREVGHLAEALVHARAAVDLDPGRSDALELVARILLEGPEPDPHGAEAALAVAVRRPDASVESRILHAECLLRIYGALPPGAYPPEVAMALASARDCLAKIPSDAGRPGEALLRARILLACGEPQHAWAQAASARDDLDATAPPETIASLHVAAGHALLAWRDDRDGASREFVAALGIAPSEATCHSIVGPLAARGADAFAAQVLASAVRQGDPAGVVGTSLAESLLRAGRPRDAADAAARLPESARACVCRGDALASLGERDSARAAFARASELEPGWPVPRTRTALLALSLPEGAARTSAVESGLATLASLAADHPRDTRVLGAIARLELAAGRPERAAEAALLAAKLAPADLHVLRLVADAHLAAGTPEALRRAAGVLQQMRSLRPGVASIAAEEASALLRCGDAAGALGVATRQLERLPDDVALLELRASAEMQLGHWLAAADDLARLRKLSPPSPSLLLASAECAFRTGDRTGARRLVDEASAAAGSDLQPFIELLRLTYRGEDLARTVEGLRATGASSLAARVLLLAGDAMGAEAAAREALAGGADDAAAIETLVLAMMDARGADPAARAEGAALVARLPESVLATTRALLRCRIHLAAGDGAAAWQEIEPHRARIPRTAPSWFLCGLAAFESGRTAEGLSFLRQALTLPGASATMPQQVADRMAAAALLERDLHRRDVLLREAQGIDGTHPRVACLRSEICFLRGDFARGAQLAEDALAARRAGPADEAALRFRAAGCRIATGQADLAETHVRALETLDRSSPMLPLLRGHTALVRRRFDDADREFASVAAGNPDDPLAAHGCVLVAIHRGDRAGALERIDRWSAAHPADTVVVLAAARVFAQLSDRDAAVRVLGRAAASAPASHSVATALVRTLIEAGRHAEAVAAARAHAGAAPHGDPAAAAVVAEALLASPGGASDALGIATAVAASDDSEWRHLGTVLSARAQLSLRNPDEALRLAESVLAANPPPGEGHETYARDVAGLAASTLERWPLAVRHLRREAELLPRDARVLNNAAWAMRHVPEHVKQGLSLARLAAELRPAEPSIWSTVAACAHAAGELEQASAACLEGLRRHEAAPERDPAGRARLALLLAQVLADRNLPDEARSVARSVASFRPAPPADILRRAEEMASR